MEMRSLLRKFTQNVEVHARWLNSLSYLEYRGFRKIARSQRTEDMDEGLLLHAMEEVRHALYFKRLAIKVGGARFSVYRSDTLHAVSDLKSYFYNLDKGVELLCEKGGIESSRVLYQCVTWLIEERAMRVYQEYEVILKEAGISYSLRPVLNDEGRHLDDVRTACLPFFEEGQIKVEALFKLEEECFSKVWAAFESHL